MMVREFGSLELFIIEPRADDPSLARTVTCRLCGDVLFDQVRDAADSYDLLFHGMRAHYQIRHDIRLAETACTDPDCLQHKT